MTAVLNEIERIRRNELAALWTKNEAAMLAKLAKQPPVDLVPHQEFLAPFMEFCAKHVVRHCPARPATVATYLAEISYRGAEFVLKGVEAIEALHEYHGISNPTHARLVQAALETTIVADPPRWPAEDKILFGRLPLQIKQRIAERESQRDRALFQAKNQLNDERKKLNAESKTEGTPASSETAAQAHTAAPN